MLSRQHTTEKYPNNEPDENNILNDFHQNIQDEFTKEFLQNRIHVSGIQKLILSTGSSLASLLNPHRYHYDSFIFLHNSFRNAFVEIKLFVASNFDNCVQTKEQYVGRFFLNNFMFIFSRHDMIACLGETTGVHSLTNILAEMRRSEEGSRILIDKPRINTRTIDLDALKNLPEDSFGYLYRKFLDDNVMDCDKLLTLWFVQQVYDLFDICSK